MTKLQLEYWESAFKVAAFFAATIFFIWKIFAGWLIANMDVLLETERQTKDDSNDWLKISLSLKKGNIDAVWLKDISMKVYNAATLQEEATISITEFESFEVSGEKIQWNDRNEKRKYSIATGETFQYGKIISLPSGQPYIIECRVFGKRILWAGGPQWRSSAASLPVKK